jgi:hypothetical protein
MEHFYPRELDSIFDIHFTGTTIKQNLEELLSNKSTKLNICYYFSRTHGIVKTTNSTST